MGLRLPAEYQEVEFLESTGTQYIDLPAPVGTVSVEVIISANTQTAVVPFDVFGTVGTSNRLQASQQAGSVMFAGFGATYKSDVAGIFTDGAWHTVSLSNDGLFLDGAKIWNTNQTVFNSNAPLHLFASYNLSRMATGLRTKRIAYTSNGIDYLLVPCYRKSDNKPGVYDLNHDVFHTNQGTGEFLVGGDVIDSISPWLVARRRMLMNPYWDYVWTYEDGLLSENGWEKTITGTASETMGSEGVLLTSSAASNNYIRLSREDFNVTSGIFEVVFTPLAINESNNNRIAISNGTNGICLFLTYDSKTKKSYWCFLDGTASTSTRLWNFLGINHEYPVHIELLDGVGNIRIGNTWIARGLRSSDCLYTDVTSVWSQSQGGSGLFKSIKFKRLK